MKGVSVFLIWLAALWAAVPAACEPVNVILVVLDTVRADHTSPYGYGRDTTPALNDLARRGAVFETALSQADWTLPAFASLFTGHRPCTHGVFTPRDRLPASEPTLAGLYRSHGFDTAFFTAGVVGGPDMTRGFAAVHAFLRDHGMGSLDQTLPAALEWLGSRPRKPFFLVIHGGDAHYPFDCPKEYRDRFDPDAGNAATKVKVDHFFTAAFNVANALNRDWLRLTMSLLDQAAAVKTDPVAMARIAAQYDGCLSYGASRLPALYEKMTQLKLWENTILIVTADHGEELGEHGGLGHIYRPLYEEILRVPLIFYLPKDIALAGRRIPEPVEQIDLFATLLDLEGWEIPAGTEGRSFRALLQPGPRAWSETGQYSQSTRSELGVKMLDLEAFRDEGWKVVRQGRRWELFNLAQDPAEHRDLLDKNPEVFLRLAGRMMRLKIKP